MANDWRDEEAYWRANYSKRPYADQSDYDTLQGGYRYGYESANRYGDRSWEETESDLQRGWNAYEHRGRSTWEQVKAAVRDAWDRVTKSRPSHVAR